MLDDKKWQLVNELVRGGHVPGPAGREGYTDLRTDYSFDPGETSGQGQSQSVFKETDQLELPLLAMTTFPVWWIFKDKILLVRTWDKIRSKNQHNLNWVWLFEIEFYNFHSFRSV